MHRRLADNHDAMLARIRVFERRAASGTRSDPNTLAKGRFAFAQQFGAHNALVGHCLRSLSVDRLPQSAQCAIVEYGKRVRALRMDYSACVNRWPLDVIMADWDNYVPSTLRLHKAIKDHMAWERDVIFPLIWHFLDRATATELLDPKAGISSSGPSSPAPRHTIAASS